MGPLTVLSDRPERVRTSIQSESDTCRLTAGAGSGATCGSVRCAGGEGGRFDRLFAFLLFCFVLFVGKMC